MPVEENCMKIILCLEELTETELQKLYSAISSEFVRRENASIDNQCRHVYVPLDSIKIKRDEPFSLHRV